MNVASGELFQKQQPLQEAWAADRETLGKKSTGIKKCYNSELADLHILKYFELFGHIRKDARYTKFSIRTGKW